jgi:DNA-binding helix-hairpin-helix protein with protein kinase domain
MLPADLTTVLHQVVRTNQQLVASNNNDQTVATSAAVVEKTANPTTTTTNQEITLAAVIQNTPSIKLQPTPPVNPSIAPKARKPSPLPVPVHGPRRDNKTQQQTRNVALWLLFQVTIRCRPRQRRRRRRPAQQQRPP